MDVNTHLSAQALSDNLHRSLTGETVAIAKLGDVAGNLAVNLLLALLILTLTMWLSGWASALVRRALRGWPRTARDATLQDFVGSAVRYIVITLGVVALLRRIGVETTSIITVLGAASLAIGLALQGALSNVAAGVMILLFRPYQVGDYVTIAGKSGTVKRLDLFNTELKDVDNLKVVVPNGKAFGDVVTNYSELTERRFEFNVGVDYKEDLGRAIEVLKACAEADPRILKDPAPWCNVTDLAPSAVTLSLRVWMPLDVYWDARFDLIRRVKEAFEREHIAIPYPTQRSLNVTAEPAVAPQFAVPRQGAPEAVRKTVSKVAGGREAG